MKKSLFLLLAFTFLSVSIGIVSAAYSDFLDIPFSPSELLENEWVVFGALFLIFFAVIFFAVNKKFDNLGIALVISTAISLLISATFANKVTVYGYFGDIIGSWIIIGVIVVALFFLARLAYQWMNKWGILAVLGLLWLFAHFTNPWDIFPYDIISDNFEFIYWLLGSWYALGVLVIVGIVLWRGLKPGEREEGRSRTEIWQHNRPWGKKYR